MRKKNGFVLVSVLFLVMILSSIGMVSVYMSRSLLQSATGEFRYKNAQMASEYGINFAINQILANKNCGTFLSSPAKLKQSTDQNNYNTFYSYSSVASSDNNYCFIKAEGIVNNGKGDIPSKVVKTVVLPLATVPGGGGAGAALSTKSVGNLIINGTGIGIKSDCSPAISYESCSWCSQTNNSLQNKISGDPKTKQTTFTLENNFTKKNKTELFSAIDTQLFKEANDLINSGNGNCVYMPPNNSRNGANCNSAGPNVISCSGSLNKTINLNNCPKVVIYAEAVNINSDMSAKDLFISTSNNLTINNNVKGIFTTNGDLNVSLNNGAKAEGIFLGSRANNLNVGNNSQLNGLYGILNNNSSLSVNMGDNSKINGAMLLDSSMNMNINGNNSTMGQIKYDPDKINLWKSKLEVLKEAGCGGSAAPNYAKVNNFMEETLLRAY